MRSNARTLDWSGNEWLAGTLSMQSSLYKGTLQVTTLGADRTYTLPNKTGTIALTSDIPTLSKTGSGSGNAVTEISVSNHGIAVTKGDTFVNLSSTQTITGEKTFDTTTHISGGTALRFDDTEVDGAGYRAHLGTGSSGDANGFRINVFQDNIANNTVSDYYTYGFDPTGVIWANNVALDLTAKRLIYNDSSTDILTTSSHYVDNTKLAINSTSAPTETLYVNGNANINGSLTLNTALSVANGGTGASSFTANSLIISGSTSTSALTTRSITNNTSNTAASTSTNIPTMNTLYYTLAQINNADQTHATSVYAPTSAGTANSILYSGGTNTAPSWTTGHYVNNTKLAINSTSAPTENLYVNGTTRFAIGNSDTAGDKRFIIGSSGKRYLSFGGAGVQAYDSNDDASQLFLNYNGGTLSIGRSATITCDTTLYGKLTATEYAKVIINDTNGIYVRDGTNSTNYVHGYVGTTGSTSTAGLAYLTVGNSGEGRSTQTRTAGNAEGRIYLYSTATKAHIIRGASTTSDRSHYFPSATGWIATGGNGTSTGAGAARNPVYLSTSGILTAGAVTLGTSTLTSGQILYTSADDTIDVAPFKYIPYDNVHYFSGGRFVPTTEGTACLGDEDYGWVRLYLDVQDKNPQNSLTGNATDIYMGMSCGDTLVGLNTKNSRCTLSSEPTWANGDAYPAFFIRIPTGSSTTAGFRFDPYLGSATYGTLAADYAEYCKSIITEPGRCVKMSDNETFSLSTARLERGCEIISDTYGMSIGKMEENDTPIAVSGRVLAYPYEDREIFRTHIGWPVCSGPNGTVSLMTEEEEEKYPSRIIGTVWGVPDYESWGTNGRAPVNGRVWIRIR